MKSVLVAADADGNLYLIDAGTGAAVLALDVWTPDGAGGRTDVGPITAMVWDPDRARILAVIRSSRIFCGGCRYTINPATGEATLLDDLGLSRAEGMTLVNENLALVTAQGEGTEVYDVHPGTGAVAFNDGNVTSGIGLGLTMAADGTLYQTSNDELYTLEVTDPSVATLVGTFAFPGFPAGPLGSEFVNSMTTTEAGTIYGIVDDGAGMNYLVAVDPEATPPEAAYKGTLAPKLDGLASVPIPGAATPVLLAADDTGDIYRIDPSSGAITLVKDVWKLDGFGNPVDIGRVGGMAYDLATSRMIAGIDDGAESCQGCVYSIDPASGHAVLLNDTVMGRVDGMERRPSDGSIIAMENFDGVLVNVIDTATGVVTSSAPFTNGASGFGFGLVFAADGTPYVTGGGFGEGINWYEVDPTDLTNNLSELIAANVGFPALLSGSEFINSVAMANDGTLYGIVEDGAATFLATILPDEDTPVVTYRATLPRHMDGLTVLTPTAVVAAALPQTGYISDLPFTVVAGAISQPEPNGPITVGPGGATLMFDYRLSLMPDIDHLNFQASFVANDGGVLAVSTHGTPLGDFSDGMRFAAIRNGTDYDYAAYFSVDATPDATGKYVAPEDPDALMLLTVDTHIDRLGPNAALHVWGLENTVPSGCSPEFVHNSPAFWGPPVGDRLSIELKDATLEEILVNPPIFNGC